MSLPPPAEDQAYCNVSALESGLIDLPLDIFITNAKQGAVETAPSLSFLIQHSKRREKFIFDLGIRKDWENYPPASIKWIKEVFSVNVPQDVVESLAKGGLTPSDITTVCLSHLHFDHTGNPLPFTNSTFVVGGESAPLLKDGYPGNPDSGIAEDLLPAGRIEFLDTEKLTPLGPFPRALDFYNDGSLYIIDAAGHLPGHLAALARTSADGGWLLMGGDSAHHWSLIKGESDIKVGHPAYASGCAHANKEAAEKNLERIRELLKNPRARVILGHDHPWYQENKNGPSFWPGRIPSL